MPFVNDGKRSRSPPGIGNASIKDPSAVRLVWKSSKLTDGRKSNVVDDGEVLDLPLDGPGSFSVFGGAVKDDCLA